MPFRLVLIHDNFPREEWEGLDATDLHATRIEWTSINAADVSGLTADIIIVSTLHARRSALELFAHLKSHPIAIPILAILPAEPDLEMLEVAAASVDDFVISPVRAYEWRQRVARLLGSDPSAAEERTSCDRLIESLGMAKLIGHAPAFLRTLARIPLAARSGSPVLITGETGTGKELCARAIHYVGPRRSAPFVPVDCGAVPDHLFENELFGHARGAYTDAKGDQRGLVGMADGGTLFLDEVDALPLTAQCKLLRFLQERMYKPLGADRFYGADVNVVSATNRDLAALVREQRFRSDLYFRLNVLSLHLAPLRARRGDIPILARHFAQMICSERHLEPKTVSALAVRKLALYDWPGNVRELFNVMQRAVVFAEGSAILPAHIATSPTADEEPSEKPVPSFRQARARALEAFERTFVEDLLQRHDGNVTQAAREAQKDRRAFGRLIKKYALPRRAS